jgi:hypothetical protein
VENLLASNLGVGVVYHVTPIHYLPDILISKELLSQHLVGYAHARPTARRRDRMLGVDRYVHCSLSLSTPLLQQKIERGYSHAILKFDVGGVGCDEIAILPCNTKAWRSRWQCQPVTDPVDIARAVRLHKSRAKFPSLEILVKDRLPLKYLKAIIVPTVQECKLVAELMSRLELGGVAPVEVAIGLKSRSTEPAGYPEIAEYFCSFGNSQQRIPMPILKFD